MKRQGYRIPLILLPILISACTLLGGRSLGADQSTQIPVEEMDTFSAEMVSEGFEFCPGTYLEISVVQIHENPHFNFFNEVTSVGELELEIFGSNQHIGLRTESQLPLEGGGRAGVCQFTSSGFMDLDIIGRLIPGENNQPNLLFFGQCNTSVQSKPPCGDFGMIPLEKKIHVVIPYKDGGSFEWDWKNQNVGISGSSKWTLHIPCDN